MFPRGRSAVIVRGPGKDKYGDPQEGEPQRIEVRGCGWGPRTMGAGPSSSEIDERGRDGHIEGLTVYMPAGTDLRPTDQLELDGVLYEVRGEPGEWVNPYTGRERGLEVAVRRAEG